MNEVFKQIRKLYQSDDIIRSGGSKDMETQGL